jgi:hypothetical protein
LVGRIRNIEQTMGAAANKESVRGELDSQHKPLVQAKQPSLKLKLVDDTASPASIRSMVIENLPASYGPLNYSQPISISI